MQWIIITVLCFICGATSAQKQNTFFQPLKSEIALPSEAGKNVIRLFNTSQGTAAITSRGIFRYTNGKWSGKASGIWRISTQDSNGVIWLASQKTIQNESGKSIVVPAMNDTIVSMYWENLETLHLGTTGGLYTWNGKWYKEKLINSRINDIINLILIIY